MLRKAVTTWLSSLVMRRSCCQPNLWLLRGAEGLAKKGRLASLKIAVFQNPLASSEVGCRRTPSTLPAYRLLERPVLCPTI